MSASRLTAIGPTWSDARPPRRWPPTAASRRSAFPRSTRWRIWSWRTGSRREAGGSAVALPQGFPAPPGPREAARGPTSDPPPGGGGDDWLDLILGHSRDTVELR